jgi:hypothetical protein
MSQRSTRFGASDSASTRAHHRRASRANRIATHASNPKLDEPNASPLRWAALHFRSIAWQARVARIPDAPSARLEARPTGDHRQDGARALRVRFIDEPDPSDFQARRVSRSPATAARGRDRDARERGVQIGVDAAPAARRLWKIAV